VGGSTVPRIFTDNIRQKHKIQGIMISKQDHHEEQVLGFWDSAKQKNNSRCESDLTFHRQEVKFSKIYYLTSSFLVLCSLKKIFSIRS
jgi:hypothetical protein